MLRQFPHLNFTLIQFSLACLVLFFITNMAIARPYSRDKNAGSAGTGFPRLNEVEAIWEARYNRIKRTIICRVAYKDIVISALIEKTDVFQPRTMHAVDRLRSRRLVKDSDNLDGQRTITPATEEARKKMVRWDPYSCG